MAAADGGGAAAWAVAWFAAPFLDGDAAGRSAGDHPEEGEVGVHQIAGPWTELSQEEHIVGVDTLGIAGNRPLPESQAVPAIRSDVRAEPYAEVAAELVELVELAADAAAVAVAAASYLGLCHSHNLRTMHSALAVVPALEWMAAIED